jgi:hypothetical protein
MTWERDVIVDFRSVAPVLLVTDVGAATAWYESVLGFKSQTFPAAPPFDEAILWRDDVRIMLTAADAPSPLRGGAAFTVKGIFGFYEAIRERVTITQPLTRELDGTLSFEMSDPSGYTLTFTEEADAA